jgi:hypothetical protein
MSGKVVWDAEQDATAMEIDIITGTGVCTTGVWGRLLSCANSTDCHGKRWTN